MDRLPQSFVDRAQRLLNLRDFAEKSMPFPVAFNTAFPTTDRQYILRMMVRSAIEKLSIPKELFWLAPTIRNLVKYQDSHGLHNPFIYVTVRHGIVTSETDDQWHVDGFSMRTPHVPEQNYICVEGDIATQYLLKSWQIPDTFDPLVHNIHEFFRDDHQPGQVATGTPGMIYAIDPYCVHRRPPQVVNKKRTFWRISFVPIEIKDDTCTPNPLFLPKVYGREDIRKKLVAWK
jgi:hypothetical protein